MKFIRKNGRVIPIRESGSASPKPAQKPADHRALAIDANKKVGIAALATIAGFGLTVGGGLLLKKMVGAPGVTGVRGTLDTFKGLAAKAGKFTVNTKEAMDPLHAFANIAERSITVASKGHESILLHEVGHLAASNKKWTMNGINRMAATTGGVKGAIASGALGALKPFTNLVSEAEASILAVNAVRKVRGVKAAAKTAAELAPAYATYVGHAATTGGTIVGTGYILKGEYHQARIPRRPPSKIVF